MRPAVKPSLEKAPRIPVGKGRKKDSCQTALTFTLPQNCPARLHLEDLEHPEDFTRRLAEWLMRQR